MKRPFQMKYRFPWREGNHFELLIDAEYFFPRMIQAIDDAQNFVLMEMYLFESGSVASRFIDILIEVAQRGVTVALLLDDFGARGLNRYDRRRLRNGGVRLMFYNRLYLGKWFRNLTRDHRKLLVIDGVEGFVGGAGITDAFDPPGHPEKRWRENMIHIKGPVMADWQTLFFEVWDRQVLQLPALTPMIPDRCDSNILGRVLITRGLRWQDMKRALLKRIANAERRVWIATAYFVPSWRFRRALRRAAGRGIDVRILLPGQLTDHSGVRFASHRYYTRLLMHGVRIFEYQPRVFHAKAALCDSWSSFGSSNFDRWNIRWNLEANQSIDDPRFAERVERMFIDDFNHCLEIHYEEWQHRPWYLRWRERIFGWLDRLLTSLGKGRGHEG
jgi:cardiolipin synthase A/B